jgi:hypothetical protein
MAYSNKFPTTLPIDINFFNAESLSPIKLNSIFEYLKMANTSIEVFLGNGIDYDATTPEKRKLIGNISNLIGDVAGNIYMPYNYFGTVYSLYKSYCSSNGNTGSSVKGTYEHAKYNSVDDSIEIIGDINIPVNRSFKYNTTIGIHYSMIPNGSPNTGLIQCYVAKISGENDVTTTNTNIITNIAVSAGNTIQNAEITVPSGTFISHIRLSNSVNANLKFNVYSLYLCKSTVSTNAFYALGKDHKSLYVCGRTCKWSHASYNAVSGGATCPYIAVSGACIGNTYDIYSDDGTTIASRSGIPVCGGTESIAGHTISNSLVTYKNGVSGDQYQYETTYVGVTPSHYVMQSPLISYTEKNNIIKYKPTLMTNTVSTLSQSEAFVYDFKSTSGSPILFNATIVGTGRKDIVKIYNTSLNVNDNNKYIFISSEIGISQMINAMVELASLTTNRTIAVYAD